jgi:hypothetical protein
MNSGKIMNDTEWGRAVKNLVPLTPEEEKKADELWKDLTMGKLTKEQVAEQSPAPAFDFIKWVNIRFHWEDPEMPHIAGTEDGGIMLMAFDPRGPEDSAEGKSLKEVAFNWDQKHYGKDEWKNGEWFPEEDE